jgi:hypothetical protein
MSVRGAREMAKMSILVSQRYTEIRRYYGGHNNFNEFTIYIIYILNGYNNEIDVKVLTPTILNRELDKVFLPPSNPRPNSFIKEH